jgi:hypothetical protein
LNASQRIEVLEQVSERSPNPLATGIFHLPNRATVAFRLLTEYCYPLIAPIPIDGSLQQDVVRFLAQKIFFVKTLIVVPIYRAAAFGRFASRNQCLFQW